LADAAQQAARRAKRPPSDRPALALAARKLADIEFHGLTAGRVAPLLREPSHRAQLIPQTRYQWRHLPAGVVVSDFMDCPRAIHSTEFGII